MKIIEYKVRDYFVKRRKLFNKILIYSILTFLLIFRFTLIFANLDWQDDTARDQIFARLIFKNQEFVGIGHWNSGLGINYPPYYYYILSSIRTIHDSYGMVLLVHIILSLIALVYIFKITRILSSKLEGFIAVSLCLIAPIMINISSSVWSIYFSVSFGIIAMYWGIKAFYTKPQNTLYLTLAITTTSFLTTIFYGASLQLLLLIALVFLLGNRGVIKKIYFLLLAAITFSLFNFQIVLHNNIFHLINLNLNPILDTNISDYKYFISHLYQNMANNIVRPEFVIVFGFISLFLFIVYLFCRNKRINKIIVCSLFFYCLVAIFFSAKSGEVYYGVLQYPFIYVLLAIFSTKINTFNKKRIFVPVYVFLLLLFYAIFPQSLFDNFLYKIPSRYSLIKIYSFQIIDKSKGDNVLILSAFEKNGVALYWPSTNFWYYDTFFNPKSYILQPTKFCPVTTSGICYTSIPDKIVLICPLSETNLGSYLSPISLDLCSKELNRLTSLVGIPSIQKAEEINYITVDKNKYLNLKKSLIE